MPAATLSGCLLSDKTSRSENFEKEIAEITTREQQRIGQELHDGLGQETHWSRIPGRNPAP